VQASLPSDLQWAQLREKSIQHSIKAVHNHSGAGKESVLKMSGELPGLWGLTFMGLRPLVLCCNLLPAIGSSVVVLRLRNAGTGFQ
jgi:hypothetical protein